MKQFFVAAQSILYQAHALDYKLEIELWNCHDGTCSSRYFRL